MDWTRGFPNRRPSGGLRRIALSAALALGFLALPPPARGGEIPWVVYYADTAPVSAFAPYRLVILDSDHYPPLQPLKDQGKILVGYVSLGQVERYRRWFGTVKKWGILADEDPNWPGSFNVDVRDNRWQALVLQDIIPAILGRGFEGVFLDTLDIAGHLERQDPVRHAGMTAAAARLVQAIRAAFPGIRIVQNRAYEILPQTAPVIDFALGESVYTSWDAARGHGGIQRAEDIRFQVEALKNAKRINHALELLSLDYWNPEDRDGIRKIYAAERANGFSPYVSVIALNRIIPEP